MRLNEGALALILATLLLVPVQGTGARITDLVEPAAEATATTLLAQDRGSWTPNVILTKATLPRSNQVEPGLDVDSKGRVSVAFKMADSPSGGGAGIGYAWSADAGSTWSDAKSLTTGGSDAWLTHDENDTFILATLENGISARRSTDGGATWSALVKANPGGGSSDKESISSDRRGRVYMAYDDKSASRVKTSVSTDGGRTWSTVVDLADRTESSVGAAYVVGDTKNGGAYAVFFVNDDIWFDKSADGRAWGTDVRVNDNVGSATGSGFGAYKFGSIPAMAVAPDGTLYVVWWDKREGRLDIYGARSEDRGATWSANFRVNELTAGNDQWMPDIAVDSKGAVHAAWYDERSGAYQVMYSNSTDKGATWSTNVPVTDASSPLSFDRPGDYMTLRVGPDDSLYAAWTDGRAGSALEVAFSKKLGTAPANNAPSLPTITGPTSIQDTQQPIVLNFSSTDPDADDVSYVADWGDGSTSTSGLNASGATSRLAHKWAGTGTYDVRAKARDARGKESGWSAPHSVLVYVVGGNNSPPAAPTISGPTLGEPAVALSFDFTATDPDGDQLTFAIEWGDGLTDSVGGVASGQSIARAHPWSTAGAFEITARATDAKAAAGPWSAPYKVTIKAPDPGDTTPPVIQHDPVAKSARGKPISLGANVSDDKLVAKVLLHYRPDGGKWESRELQQEGGTGGGGPGWLGGIPASATPGAFVDYYFWANDTADNAATHPTANPESKPHRIELFASPPDGSGQGGPGQSILGLLASPLFLAIIVALIIVGLVALVLAKRRRRRADHAGSGWYSQGPNTGPPG